MQQQSPPTPPSIRQPPRLVARTEESPPRRADDRFDRQAEQTILAIAEDRRRLDAVIKERNDLYDANAKACAQVDLLREMIKKMENDHSEAIRQKNEEIVRQKILTDSWHGEAMRLRSAGDLAFGAWMQAMGQGEEAETGER